jgi:hypothetical protein
LKRHLAEIFVGCQEGPSFGATSGQDCFIGCAGLAFTNPSDIEARIPHRLNSFQRKVLIGKKFHAGSSGNSLSA